jgi:hypothetical protein
MHSIDCHSYTMFVLQIIKKKISREKEMSMEDSAAMAHHQHGPNGGNGGGGGDGGRVKWSATMAPNTRKASANQRIGIGRPR